MTRQKKAGRTTARTPHRGISAAKLAEMIEAATQDAYDEAEQTTGWFTMLDEHLELPFDTIVLGVPVHVSRIEQPDDGRLVAICTRGNHDQAVALVDLPLPARHSGGTEWIEAYRSWRRRR